MENNNATVLSEAASRELGLLGSLIAMPEHIPDACAKLNPDCFTHADARKIFIKLLEANGADGHVDTAALIASINGSVDRACLDYIFNDQNQPFSSSIALEISGILKEARISGYRKKVYKASEILSSFYGRTSLPPESDLAKLKTSIDALLDEISPKPESSLYRLTDFLETNFGKIEPLIGSANDALLVPGEGLMLPGTGGAGKTAFLVDMAIKAAFGLNILKWQLSRPLRVRIYQAELPPQFFQQRLRGIVADYSFASKEKADMAAENIFVANVVNAFDMAEKGNAVQVIGEDASKCKPDLIFIDPFLSFYSGDENDNPTVRRDLDRLKREIAEKLGCGLIISDHQPKYAATNREQQTSIRGAGAKRDWAASVLALSEAKTPEGEHGKFIRIVVDKLRYGPKPGIDFVLKRFDSFRHELWRGCNIPMHRIAEAIADDGGNLAKNRLMELLQTNFEVPRRDAASLIQEAIETRWITVEDGPKKSKLHNVGEAYDEWKTGE